MAGRRTLLTEEVEQALVEAIESGAYDWVAAEGAGIGRRTFYEWLERGDRGEPGYATLATRVRRARAKARIEAEREVRQRWPLNWLRMGPGRERDGAPGWTTSSKPLVGQLREAVGDPELRALLEEILRDDES